jgi:hypothetical protein
MSVGLPCGNRSVGPSTIGKAKKAALAMVADQGMGKLLDDPIGHSTTWRLACSLQR